MIRRSHLSTGRAHYALKRGQHVDLRLTLPAQFQYKTLQGDDEPDCVLSFSADNARGGERSCNVEEGYMDQLGRLPAAKQAIIQLSTTRYENGGRNDD